MARTLRIDVYFDLICPWCWIGKSLLLQARERLAASDPEARVEVYWHSVQLIADVPEEGWPYAAFYERRLGSTLAVRAPGPGAGGRVPCRRRDDRFRAHRHVSQYLAGPPPAGPGRAATGAGRLRGAVATALRSLFPARREPG
ncbi:DsbA family protein [Polaromonas sp. P1-6]|nr:DsbA family protein [Polaromonas sp. P1-6]